MKPSRAFLMTVLALALAGCATSTLESRKKERYGAYASLSSEQKASVDQAQIKVGMSMDAVYIAWGKPSQILTSETASDSQVRWLYSGTYLQSFSYWAYPGYYGPYRWGYCGPEFVHDYVVLNYIRAEVIFEGGLVKQWRTLPRPGY